MASLFEHVLYPDKKWVDCRMFGEVFRLFIKDIEVSFSSDTEMLRHIVVTPTPFGSPVMVAVTKDAFDAGIEEGLMKGLVENALVNDVSYTDRSDGRLVGFHPPVESGACTLEGHIIPICTMEFSLDFGKVKPKTTPLAYAMMPRTYEMEQLGRFQRGKIVREAIARTIRDIGATVA